MMLHFISWYMVVIYVLCTGDGGVFATKHIHRGEFILQYAGEHISGMEAQRREKEYQKGRRCYMCLYDHNEKENKRLNNIHRTNYMPLYLVHLIFCVLLIYCR